MEYGLLAAAPTPVNHLRNARPIPPEDCDECVFLPRAFDRIGAAKYGAAWSGNERNISIPEPLPDAIDPSLMQARLPNVENIEKLPAQWFEHPTRTVLDRADRLLNSKYPERPFRGRLSVLTSLMTPVTFTYAEWKEAQAEALAEREHAISAFGRREEVIATIKRSCLRGKMKTRLRRFEGGDYSDILPACAWRSEDLFLRFFACRMHPREYFRIDAPDNEYCWIFVTRDSLERLERELKRDRGCIEEVQVSHYESEYRQCMRLVSEALDISADNMPKKAVVENEIPRHWYGNKESLSPTEIRWMASFIRSEASRGGRRSHT